MKIQTNYNNIYNYPKYQYNRANIVTGSNVNFEGIRLDKIIQTKAQNEYLKSVAIRYSAMINQNKDVVLDILRNTSSSKVDFFKTLAKKYNARNFELPLEQREDSSQIFELLKLVKKPKDYHYMALENIDASMEYFKKLFSASNNKMPSEFIFTFKRSMPGNYKTHFLNIFKSPHSKEYIKKYDDYRDYFILNYKNDNAVAELDKMVENKTYDKSLYKVRLLTKGYFDHTSLSFDKAEHEKLMHKYYSPESYSVLKTFLKKYVLNIENIPKSSYEDIMHIYMTSNKSNAAFRENLMRTFKHSAEDFYNNNFDPKELSALKELFYMADNDKHVKKFITKLTKRGLNINKIQEITDILAVAPAKKLNIFFDNFVQIYSYSKGSQLYKALQTELENPFYARKVIKERYKHSYYKPSSNMGPVGVSKAYIRNGFNILRDKVTPTKDYELISEAPESMQDVILKPIGVKAEQNLNTTSIPREKSLTPIVSPIILERTLNNINNNLYRPVELPKFDKLLRPEPQINHVDLVKAEKQSHIAPNKALTLVREPIILEKTLANINAQEKLSKNLPIKKSFKELREARKLQVISDVNNIIEKKLGTKTLDKQKAQYDKQATKIRLSLLPEIFESIKSSRKLERELGVKTPSIANKDAIKLYERINGNNRKLVRYMLLKTKSKTDDTRLFTIKDILRVLDKAEEEIPVYKSIDPAYKPRAYYNEIFDKYVDQYGKVSRRKKK